MNAIQQLADCLNQWTLYQWVIYRRLDVQRTQSLQRLEKYASQYQRCLAFQNKMAHYQTLCARKGIVPPSYRRGLQIELEDCFQQASTLERELTQDPLDREEDSFLSPTWLLDLREYQDEQNAWKLYPYWNWLYQSSLWNEYYAEQIRDMDKQQRFYEQFLYTSFSEWYQETLAQLSCN